MTARPRGFTLLEVVVAFAIFALTTAAVMRTIGNSLSMSTVSARHAVATLIAESRLAAVGVENPLAAGETTGRAAGGFDWRARVAAIDVEETDSGETAAAGRVQPFAITVTVGWRDGGRDRSVTLRTVRVAHIEDARQ